MTPVVPLGPGAGYSSPVGSGGVAAAPEHGVVLAALVDAVLAALGV